MPTFKSIIPNIKANNRDRKRQEENDALAQSIIASTTAQQKHPELGTPIDKPLVDEHPGLDLALMYAQPGSILTKALAPSAYKNMVQGFTNGESSLALIPLGWSTEGAELLGLPKAARKKLSWNDLQLKDEIGRGDEAIVYNTGLGNRFVLKIERPGYRFGPDWVEKSLNMPKIAKTSGARTYYVGDISGKRVLAQEKVKPFANSDSFIKSVENSGLRYNQEMHIAEHPIDHWDWLDARPSNSGIGVDNKLKIIDGLLDKFLKGGTIKSIF